MRESSEAFFKHSCFFAQGSSFMPLRVFLLLARRCCVFFHQQHLRKHLMQRTLSSTKLLILINQKRSSICSQLPFSTILATNDSSPRLDNAVKKHQNDDN